MAYGLSSDDIVRYRNASQTKWGLDHHRGSDPGNPRPVMLWAYDPLAFNGQGRAAIAIDNPDEAENIAIICRERAAVWRAGGCAADTTPRSTCTTDPWRPVRTRHRR